MRKLFLYLCAIVLVVSMITGCTSGRSSEPTNDPPGVSQETGVPEGSSELGESGLTDPGDSGSPDDGGLQGDYGSSGGTRSPCDNGLPVVYFTADITPESLVAIYNALGVEPFGNIAIKIHTGEPPNSNYLRPELIGDLVRSIGGTLVVFLFYPV